MAVYNIGDVIRTARERQGLSQEALCDDIGLAVSTLSNIETHNRYPNKRTVEQLLMRLDLPLALYNIGATDAEYDRYRLEQKIVIMVARNAGDVRPLMQAYKDVPSPMNPFEEQFYQFMVAKLQERSGTDPKKVLALLERALRCTVQDFTRNDLSRRRYFFFYELDIMTDIALMEQRLGMADLALRQMHFAHDCFRTHEMDPIAEGLRLPHILERLSAWENDRGNYTAAYTLAENGLVECREHLSTMTLDLLAYNKAVALAGIGRAEEARAAFTQAYLLMDAMKHTPEREQAQRAVRQRFGEEYARYP